MIPESGRPDAIPLAKHEDVRLHVPVAHRKDLPGAAHAGLHLVRDEEDAVGPGDLAQARHEAGRWHDVAALAEDRLDDDRRNVLGVRQRVQGQVELLLPVAGAARIGSVATAGRAVAIGERRAVHGAGERLEVAAIDVFAVVSAIVWAVRPW